MCAGKLSPAKPHLTNCKTRFTVGAGRLQGGLGRAVAYPCAVIAYNWRLVHRSRPLPFVGLYAAL